MIKSITSLFVFLITTIVIGQPTSLDEKRPSAKAVQHFINKYTSPLLEKYGAIAVDSCKSLKLRLQSQQQLESFLVKAQRVPFVADTSDYNVWLANTLENATSPEDSIENICQWIAGNYPFGETDIRSKILSPELIYKNILSGTIFGECGDYVSFLSKLAKNFASWGTPVPLSSGIDSILSGGGTAPSHTFLGFVNEKGSLWCIADPTIGGVLRDSEGHVLNLRDLKKHLQSPEKAWDVSVRGVESSVQQGWDQYLPKVMFRDTVSLFIYTTPAGENLIRGHWLSFQDDERVTSNLAISYWKIRGYPRMTWLNIYAETKSPLNSVQLLNIYDQ